MERDGAAVPLVRDLHLEAEKIAKLPLERDQVGILPQQRKQPSAAVQAGEKPVERNDRSVWIRRTCKMLEQKRYDFRELGARELAFERAVASAIPAPH